MNTVKKVFLEGRFSGWDLHSLYTELIQFPPDGYEFVLAAEKSSLSSQNVIYSLNRRLVKHYGVKTLYDYVRPFGYYFQYRLGDRSKPRNVDLTYASQHVVFRRMPWVVDLEHAAALVAYGKTRVLKGTIEKSLESEYCRKVLPWTEMGKRTLISCFDCRRFEEKIEVVNLAVHPKKFRKEFNDDKIRLLFVGTANRVNINDSFAIKGGNEVLKAFEILRMKYRNLEMIMRSYVPRDVKERCSCNKGLKIIDGILPWEALDYEFRTADIFLFPGHSTPGMVILDAMSYELPVVATNVWANKELVKDGVTGFLIRGSSKVRYHNDNFIPFWGEPAFMKAVREPDAEMVEELVEKTRILIEDAKLRRSMGRAARKEIENGKFSVLTRNRKLKSIFDEATESR